MTNCVGRAGGGGGSIYDGDIQHFDVTIVASSNQIISITSVDWTRSVIVMPAAAGGSVIVSSGSRSMRVDETSSTSITVDQGANVAAGGSMRVSVVQYKTGVIKSKQEVTSNMGNGTATVGATITATEIAKTLTFDYGDRYATVGTSNMDEISTEKYQSTTTNIQFTRTNASASGTTQGRAVIMEFF